MTDISKNLQLPTENSPASMLSGPQTVESLRDSGYQDTERALAELIDNSYEANAKNVVVVIVQEKAKHAVGQKRPSSRATEIYVIDDGDGMSAAEMNQALAFGAGTRQARRGIGRFGMGLPQASVSQARRIDTWSWTDAFGQALHTRVDLDEIAEHHSLAVPWPKPALAPWNPPPRARDYVAPSDPPGLSIPEFLLDGVAEVFGEDGAAHGTIVAWSKLDRTTWATAEAVADHMAFFLGRIYRRFLADKEVQQRYDAAHGVTGEHLYNALDVTDVVDVEKAEPLLRAAPELIGTRRLFVRVVNRIQEGDSVEYGRVTTLKARGLDTETGRVAANDPEYLLPAAGTNLGSWEDLEGKNRGDSPFSLHKTPQTIFVQSRKKGDSRYYPVFISTSHSKPESRGGDQAGSTDYGRHAKRNQGISVVRCDRELVLLDILSEDTQRRFVGVRVEFSPELDEVFGVTNNKQEVTQLTAAIKVAKDNDNEPLSELIREGKVIDGSPVAAIYPVARAIRERFTATYKVVKNQKAGSTKSRGTPGPATTGPEISNAVDVDLSATEDQLTEGEQKAIRDSLSDDYEPAGQTDIVEDLLAAVEGASDASLIYNEEDIEVIAANLAAGSAYAFLIEFDSEKPAFFRVDERIGVPEARGRSKIIWLNMDHPIWSQYLDDLRLSDDEMMTYGENQLREVVRKARGTIINMLIAWARVELGGMPTEKLAAEQTRERWGHQARRYIQPDDESAHDATGSLFDDLAG